MAQLIEISLIAGFFLLACFFVGKKWGERKYLKIKEELKAHELAFNQLLEKMEMVSTHNLKALETKTEELRQLVPVIDKKLLFAGDLLQELDGLPKSSGLPVSVRSEPTVDFKLRREVQEIISEMRDHLLELESRLESLESAERKRLTREIHRPTRPPSTPDLAFADESPVMFSEKVFEKTPAGKGATESKSPLGRRDFPADRPASSPPPRLKTTPGPSTPLPPTTALTSSTPPTSASLRAASLGPKPRAFVPASALALEAPPTRELRPPYPTPGSPSFHVLTMRKKGMALPQIARELNMGHGEVELIAKIYAGVDEPLRKLT